jgi:hypothetical protein
MPKTGRVIYRGSAYGAAASITRLQDHDLTVHIPAQPKCSLPSIGGVAEHVIKGFTDHRFARFLAYESAKATAGAREVAAAMAAAAGQSAKAAAGQRSFEVMVAASVKKVQIGGRFEAREVHAQLRSLYKERGKRPALSCQGTYLRGLKLDGYAIEVELETESAGGDLPRPGKRSDGRASIAKKINTRHPDVKIDRKRPHVLELAGFGSITFGEVVAGSEMNRMTLLRLSLESSDAGIAELCDVHAGAILAHDVMPKQHKRSRPPLGIQHHVEDGLSGMP